MRLSAVFPTMSAVAAVRGAWTLTAVLLPEGHDAEAFRALALEHFNIAYGASFGRFTAKMFRIGHLGDINDVWLAGARAGVEMGLVGAGVPIEPGGVQAAIDHLAATSSTPASAGAAVP